MLGREEQESRQNIHLYGCPSAQCVLGLSTQVSMAHLILIKANESPIDPLGCRLSGVTVKSDCNVCLKRQNPAAPLSFFEETYLFVLPVAPTLDASWRSG